MSGNTQNQQTPQAPAQIPARTGGSRIPSIPHLDPKSIGALIGGLLVVLVIGGIVWAWISGAAQKPADPGFATAIVIMPNTAAADAPTPTPAQEGQLPTQAFGMAQPDACKDISEEVMKALNSFPKLASWATSPDPVMDGKIMCQGWQQWWDSAKSSGGVTQETLRAVIGNAYGIDLSSPQSASQPAQQPTPIAAAPPTISAPATTDDLVIDPSTVKVGVPVNVKGNSERISAATSDPRNPGPEDNVATFTWRTKTTGIVVEKKEPWVLLCNKLDVNDRQCYGWARIADLRQ